VREIFTRAGLRQIALCCGASAADAASGDPMLALLRRRQMTPGNVELVGPTSSDGLAALIHLVGFIEAGARFGYLDLSTYNGRTELQTAVKALARPDQLPDLARDLILRLESDAPPEPMDPGTLGLFETYTRLDSDVRADADIEGFLRACRDGTVEQVMWLPGEGISEEEKFIDLWPRAFAEEIVYRGDPLITRKGVSIRMMVNGGHVRGRLHVAFAYQRLLELLELIERAELREVLLRHAAWSHRADLVFAHLQSWVAQALHWRLADQDPDDSSGWQAYVAAVIEPLLEHQRALDLMAVPTWRPWRNPEDLRAAEQSAEEKRLAQKFKRESDDLVEKIGSLLREGRKLQFIPPARLVDEVEAMFRLAPGVSRVERVIIEGEKRTIYLLVSAPPNAADRLGEYVKEWMAQDNNKLLTVSAASIDRLRRRSRDEIFAMFLDPKATGHQAGMAQSKTPVRAGVKRQTAQTPPRVRRR
jgi:hypothetical protein